MAISLAYEGTTPAADLPAILPTLPEDGREYVLLSIPAGNTVNAIVEGLQALPQIEQALTAKTTFGKIFGLLAIAGELGVGQ